MKTLLRKLVASIGLIPMLFVLILQLLLTGIHKVIAFLNSLIYGVMCAIDSLGNIYTKWFREKIMYKYFY